jgi:phosphoribosyl-ATP pyrophosphohydrolase
VKNHDHANLVWEAADVRDHLAVIMLARSLSEKAAVNAELRGRAGGGR